jgi:hypothetical protein
LAASAAPLDSGYFETFNLEQLHLVDVKSNPIAEITPAGITLQDGAEYSLEALDNATGFDAMTGPLNRIEIRGRGGKLLREKWAEGPRTYLGLTSAGSPPSSWLAQHERAECLPMVTRFSAPSA